MLQALRELEFDNVMQLGAVGKDGRLGGRLERELGLYEEVLMQKRKGAKDRKSNKAKEDAGDVGGDEDGERGEPSSKKARRMQQTDQDDDNNNENEHGDEQDMLDSQLNGDDVARGVPDKVRGKKKSNHADSGSSPTAANGKAQGDETESDHDAEQDDEEEEEDEDEDGQDNEDDDDDNNNDEDQDDDSDDDDGNEADDVEDELEGRDRTTGRTAHVGLQPNGRAEVDGSDDDSD